MDNQTPTGADQALDESMRAQGSEPYEQVGQADYFGAGETNEFKLPDGHSYVLIKTMNEGDRSKYQKDTNREVRVQKATQDAIFRMSQADERHALLQASIVGWNLIKAGQPVPFNKGTMREFLESAPTGIIDKIEKACRKANPWLISDMTVEDIDAEIASLQEMRERVEAEQEGKGD